MVNTPLFFEKNRVGRVYTGGALFADFLGDDSTDGFFPEEWIASSVVALNTVMTSPKEGVSKIEGSDIYLDELIASSKNEILGPSGKMRILVKYLDSAIRLPAQAHPDRAFSRKYFNSEYGKTESWIILGTRPDAKIFFGFKDGVGEADFIKAVEDSEFDKDAMERLMKSITPKVGDVFIVPAKTVHAIGAGCLILEVQEPTDFTIQPERWCGDYKLSDKEMYLGLTKEEALGCFDFGKTPNPEITPETISDDGLTKRQVLIDGKITPCFVINRISCTGGVALLNVKDSYGVYIVTKGVGKIIGNGYERALKQGDYFLMPACCMGKFTVFGNLELVECY